MKFKIDNIRCGGCARSVTAIVKAADANANLSIDVENKVVEIESAQLDAVLIALAEDDFPAVAI